MSKQTVKDFRKVSGLWEEICERMNAHRDELSPEVEEMGAELRAEWYAAEEHYKGTGEVGALWEVINKVNPIQLPFLIADARARSEEVSNEVMLAKVVADLEFAEDDGNDLKDRIQRASRANRRVGRCIQWATARRRFGGISHSWEDDAARDPEIGASWAEFHVRWEELVAKVEDECPPTWLFKKGIWPLLSEIDSWQAPRLLARAESRIAHIEKDFDPGDYDLTAAKAELAKAANPRSELPFHRRIQAARKADQLARKAEYEAHQAIEARRVAAVDDARRHRGGSIGEQMAAKEAKRQDEDASPTSEGATAVPEHMTREFKEDVVGKGKKGKRQGGKRRPSVLAEEEEEQVLEAAGGKKGKRSGPSTAQRRRQKREEEDAALEGLPS